MLVNTAAVKSAAPDPDPGDNGSEARTDVAPGAAPGRADLVMDKVGVGSPRVGVRYRYRLRVTNRGPDTANDVVVTDALPSSLRFVSATPTSGTCTRGQTVVCRLGALRANTTASVTIVVIPQQPGRVRNTATAQAGEGDPNVANNRDVDSRTVRDACAVPGGADRASSTRRFRSRLHQAVSGCPRLVLAKSASATSVRPGGTITYTLVLHNRGAATARDVRVCDPLPRSVTFVAARNGTLRSGEVCWRRATLAPGRSWRLRLTVRVAIDVRTTSIRNVARAAADNAPTARGTTRSQIIGPLGAVRGGGVTG